MGRNDKSSDVIVDAVVYHQSLVRFWDNHKKIHGITESRDRRNIIHRYCFINLVREATPLSLTAIGKVLDKNHATIIHAIKAHESNYKYDYDYRVVYEKMRIVLEDLFLNNGLGNELIDEEMTRFEKHERLLSLSRRLRNKIVEYERLKSTYEMSMVRVKIVQKENLSLHEENHRLKGQLNKLRTKWTSHTLT